MQYEATSLNDIAQWFERRAQGVLAITDQTNSKKLIREAKLEANAWTEAANMLKRTILIKPHKGTIENWKRLDQAPNMFKIGGLIDDDKTIITSLVMRIKDHEIETINSRYTLGKAAE